MGQKPRVCSSYFFEMEDGSRIEVRRERSRNQKEVNRVKGS